jgi:hypothetical protein
VEDLVRLDRPVLAIKLSLGRPEVLRNRGRSWNASGTEVEQPSKGFFEAFHVDVSILDRMGDFVDGEDREIGSRCCYRGQSVMDRERGGYFWRIRVCPTFVFNHSLGAYENPYTC